MATTPDTRKRLALAIVDFLNTSATDGSVAQEDRESIEVAISCISDTFKVDATDKSAIAEALGPDQNLLKIYSVYEKLRGKSTPSTQGSDSAAEGRPATPQTASAPSAASTAEAEKLKGQGNVAMQQKDYKTAIDYYSKAIDITPTNPIYLSNRAAAYSGAQQHDLAKQDAELATAADPKYTKAWSRLGLARFALGDAKGSMEAYKKGIEAEGNGGSAAMQKGYETAKRKVEQEGDEDDIGSPPRSTSPAAGGAPGGGGMPDLASLAGMLGGGGGGGGMPDLSQIMNNPMMRQMAQSVMQNPDMMSNIMNNPRLREMAGQYGGGGGAGGEGGAGGGGGGMPDLSAMMNDPNIAEMARNFMGGQGGAGGAGRGGGA